jgi:hypothetical protein
MPGRAGRWDGSLTRRPARRPSGVAVWGFCKSLISYRPNGWGRMHGTYQDRWLHGDIKNMSYFYNHKIFDSIVEQGNLQ